MAKSYENAGVNLEAGYEVVHRIKSHVKSTQRFGSMGNIGSFGGMFDLSALQIKEPVLVSGTDGVGTKLKIAFAMDKHDTIGIDAVAMCVNDVLAQGAEPLIFLDYVAVGHNIPAKVEAIVAGVAEGCRQAGCALVGGETAEMPGMYADGEYDIAGYTTGVVEKSKLIDGTKVAVGDVLVGVGDARHEAFPWFALGAFLPPCLPLVLFALLLVNASQGTHQLACMCHHAAQQVIAGYRAHVYSLAVDDGFGVKGPDGLDGYGSFQFLLDVPLCPFFLFVVVRGVAFVLAGLAVVLVFVVVPFLHPVFLRARGVVVHVNLGK